MATKQVNEGGRASNLVTRYPGGFAWPAKDDRRGRYVMCPNRHDQRMTLAVVDDFGDLVSVPSIPSEFCAMPQVPA